MSDRLHRNLVSRDLAAAAAVIDAAMAEAPRAMLAVCPAHAPTPMVNLAALAGELGLGAILFKDESQRMGLGSFKALGGGFAVAELVRRRAEAELGRALAPHELTSPQVRAIAAGLTVACASAGNHGLAVAAGAKVFGCQAKVFLADTVPQGFADRLAALGCEVVRAGADYEASLAAANAAIARNGWTLVSDVAWPGNTEIPGYIMQGYLVMAGEAADQCEAMGGVPTHIMLQAGVGGMAAAIAGYFASRYGERCPRLVVVEPDGAPCLLASLRAGRMVSVDGGPTVLGRLDCKEPSLTAFAVLEAVADDCITIADARAFEAVDILAQAGLTIGSSGAAGLGGLIEACETPAEYGLDREARVLVIGSEGPA